MTEPDPAINISLFPGGEYEGWLVLQAGQGETGVMLVFTQVLENGDEESTFHFTRTVILFRRKIKGNQWTMRFVYYKTINFGRFIGIQLALSWRYAYENPVDFAGRLDYLIQVSLVNCSPAAVPVPVDTGTSPSTRSPTPDPTIMTEPARPQVQLPFGEEPSEIVNLAKQDLVKGWG